MTQALPFTSTLMLKVPQDVVIPPYSEKPRARKLVVRRIIEILQTRQLELLYVGLNPGEIFSEKPVSVDGDCTVISINVLNAYGAVCDFNTSQEMLLRRFKRELQSHNEHILIDKFTLSRDSATRNIDIFIKSNARVATIQPNYTFSISSGSYASV